MEWKFQIKRISNAELARKVKCVKRAAASKDERATAPQEFVHCYLAGLISPVAGDGLYQGGGKGLETHLHILASSSFVL